MCLCVSSRISSHFHFWTSRSVSTKHRTNFTSYNLGGQPNVGHLNSVEYLISCRTCELVRWERRVLLNPEVVCDDRMLTFAISVKVECVWNLMAHGDAREGKWRGNWRMEWVASTLTLPRNGVYPALLTLMRTPRLPAVDWTDAPADLNGLVRFGERRNLVSALVPSHLIRTKLTVACEDGRHAEVFNWRCDGGN